MPRVGDRLGRYLLLRRLAGGGMGEVYIAARSSPHGLGPYVAIKILREELADDGQFVDMLTDEANISMFLRHQNVVSVLDLSEEDGTHYLAMEYVQGMNVARLVERRAAMGQKPDLALALYIAGELCKALKYAHTRVNHAGEPLNIIHRDVTAANILLSTQGEVKLADFGIASARGRIHRTQTGVLKGKLGYLAPEMVRFEKIDARADIFCAGICLYLLATNRHPVAGAGVVEAIQMFDEKRVLPPSHLNPEIPSSLDFAVMKALEPQPEHRWASAASFLEALHGVTLSNATWRREVESGERILIERIREIDPSVFGDPVDRRTLEQLVPRAHSVQVETIDPPTEENERSVPPALIEQLRFPDSSDVNVRPREEMLAEPSLPPGLFDDPSQYHGPTIVTPTMSFEDLEFDDRTVPVVSMVPFDIDQPLPEIVATPVERQPSKESVIAVAADLQIGIETGRWIAGDIDGTHLDWSDEAAARRVMAMRAIRGSAAQESPSVDTLYRVRSRFSRARWLPLIVAPWIIAGAIAMWTLPEIQLHTAPELEARSVTVELPVEGTVFLNGARATTGRSIILGNLPREGAVRIRVEAPGHQPYEIAFASVQDVPPQLPIPLRALDSRL